MMKCAKVVPLHKSGEVSILDNYRPISLLPVISKVLERIVYNTVTNHLTKHEILYHRQYGFRRQHSTSDAVLNLVGEILNAFDKGDMILAVFIDLKKVFDTVSHKGIIDKLKKIGIDGIELDWFRTYLEGRMQCVELNGIRSNSRNITVGIPQGSLLGVLLFQLHINDIYRCLRFSTAILYADDTTLLLSGSSLCFLKAKLQHDLSALSNWLCINSLKLNVSKTKCMLFYREGLNPYVSLTVEDQEIEMVTSFKFLGIKLDCDVSWVSHYKDLHLKLMKLSFVLHSLTRILPYMCMKVLYFSYYHSHIVYCMTSWYPLLPHNLQLALCRLQKGIVRSIGKLPYRSHCMPIFKKFGILALDDLLLVKNRKLIFRVMRGQCSKPLCNFFRDQPTHSMRYPTRNRSINVKKHSLSMVNKSFLCKAVMDWYSLDSNMKTCNTSKCLNKSEKTRILVTY